MLNQELFLDLAEARWVDDRWRFDYYRRRPLGYQIPVAFAACWFASVGATPSLQQTSSHVHPDSFTKTGTNSGARSEFMQWTPLIITVTCDPQIQDPRNPRTKELFSVDDIAKEYQDANLAGAVIDHVHGIYSRDPVVQADGKQLQIPNIEDTATIIQQIRAAHPRVTIQQGLASMRPEQKLALWEKIEPEMSSLNLNSHDEYFDPYPTEVKPRCCYSVHPINELRQYFQWSKQYGVKPELECFDSGAFDAVRIIREGIFWTDDDRMEEEKGLLDDPLWCTFFFGWPGQSCQPMTDLALFNQVYHKPAQLNWSMSCMSRCPKEYWAQINRGVLKNGHIRVGYEDCGKHPDGAYASCNADLVDRVVQMAKLVGRPIATVEEAREIIGLRAATREDNHETGASMSS